MLVPDPIKALVEKWRNDAKDSEDPYFGGIRVLALVECANELEAAIREAEATPKE